ncbi:MAG: hypothetical protein AAGA97_03805 [Pseudomonadota bacterium]
MFRPEGFAVASHVFSQDEQGHILLFGEEQNSVVKFEAWQGYVVFGAFWICIAVVVTAFRFNPSFGLFGISAEGWALLAKHG